MIKFSSEREAFFQWNENRREKFILSNSSWKFKWNNSCWS